MIDGLTISKLDTNRVVKYSTIISFVVTLVLGLCLVVTIVWLLKPGHGLIYIDYNQKTIYFRFVFKTRKQYLYLKYQTDISNIDILFTDPSVSRKLISCKLLLENSQTKQCGIISIKHLTQNSSQGISGTDLLS